MGRREDAQVRVTHSRLIGERPTNKDARNRALHGSVLNLAAIVCSSAWARRFRARPIIRGPTLPVRSAGSSSSERAERMGWPAELVRYCTLASRSFGQLVCSAQLGRRAANFLATSPVSLARSPFGSPARSNPKSAGAPLSLSLSPPKLAATNRYSSVFRGASLRLITLSRARDIWSAGYLQVARD